MDDAVETAEGKRRIDVMQIRLPTWMNGVTIGLRMAESTRAPCCDERDVAEAIAEALFTKADTKDVKE